MRIRRLDLLAFGHFTGLSLDLDGARGLHVVYGHNEAGKSTALRALRGLLYDIDERTRDDFLHPKAKLRVGASVERADGTVLEVVRRKGRKNTLLGPDDQPIDDGPLRAALGGVTEEMFVTMFGLDHEALRRGAQALLEGRGDVGESLFDAGVGGRGIHRVLERLDREAADLFAPQGKTRLLNQAIAAYKEAAKRVRTDALSAGKWEEQHEAIEQARRDRDALDVERRRLLEEKVRLERQRVVIPKLTLRAQLLEERRALGSFELVSAEDEDAHREAARIADEASREIARLEGEVSTLEARREELQIPAALTELSDDAVEALASRVGGYRKAQADLPRREADLAAAEQSARRILSRMGREVSLDDAELQRVGCAATARIGALSKEHSGLVAKLAAAREALEERQAELGVAVERLSEIEVGPDPADLSRALAAGRRDGDLEDRLEAAHARAAALRAEAERSMTSLGPVCASLEELAGVSPPSAEMVDRFAERWDALARDRESHREEKEALERKRSEAVRGLEALEGAGDVPTEGQLLRARQARDEAWRAIRARGDVVQEEGTQLEEWIERSDALADRLRREAERVTRHATLVAERNLVAREAERLDQEASRLDREAVELGREWQRACERLPLADPWPPGEMRRWLLRLAEVQRHTAELGRTHAEAERLQTRAGAHREALLHALRANGEHPTGGEPLLDLLDRAAEVIERRRRAAEARERQLRERDSLVEEVAKLERRGEARERDLAGWREQWAESVHALGLGPNATVEEATAILQDLTELFSTLDRAADQRHRIAGIRREAEALDADSRDLAARHLPDVALLPLEERVDRLVEAHRRMRAEVHHRETLDSDLSDRRGSLADARRRAEDARARVAALVARAGASDADELRRIEERSRMARELDRRMTDLEQELSELGEGATVEQLAEETREVDLKDVRVRLAFIDEDIEEVAENLRRENSHIGTLENSLEVLAQKSAAEAADEAQAHLARVREHAHRYVRLRLATAILRREIERYREENQGPILSRANELFPRLTLGRYTALRVGLDAADRAVLECVRSDGGAVLVDGLSDGTRDQLYLALRLASVERHSKHNEPLPFVVDDVLIHFDDDRARAALEVLGELSSTTQVLFFTHHARLIELARQAIPPERLCTHDLDALRARPEPEPQPSL